MRAGLLAPSQVQIIRWRNIVSANGVTPDQWKRFQPDTVTPRPDPTTNNVCPPAPPKLHHPSPPTAVITSNAAPSLEYRFHVSTGGAATPRVRLLPTFPLVSGQGLRLALAIDDVAPLPLAVTTGFDTKNSNTALTDWQRRVMANATEATLKLPQPLTPGWHTLRLVAVDAGIVVDKMVLDFGGLPPSYHGPAETRIP